jgi:signal transduction histidine kinase
MEAELASNLMAEMRAQISQVKMAVKLIESAPLKTYQKQNYLNNIRVACERQMSIIEGIETLCKLEEADINEPLPSISIHEIIPATISTYQPIASEKGISIGYTIPDTLPTIFCREDWLKQIVKQIVDNSIKYTPAGGKIFVTANYNGGIEIEFKDTGNGIEERDLPHIFQHFYRGKIPNNCPTETGVGLGLTIVDRIISTIGGSISVTSQIGQGSQFHLFLPDRGCHNRH